MQDFSLNHSWFDCAADAVCVGLFTRPPACHCYPIKMGQVWLTSEQWDSIWVKFVPVWSSSQEHDIIRYYWTYSCRHRLEIPFIGKSQSWSNPAFVQSASGSHWPGAYTRGSGPVNLALMTGVVPLIYMIGSCSGVGGPLGSPTWSALWN